MSTPQQDLRHLFSVLWNPKPHISEGCAKVCLELMQKKSGTLDDVVKYTQMNRSTCSSCCALLKEHGLMSTTRRSGKNMYRLHEDWYSTLARLVRDHSSTLDHSLQQTLAALRRMEETPSIFMIETIVKGHRLDDSELRESIRQTLDMFRRARESIAVMTRDFGWVSDAFQVIDDLLKSNASLKVQILTSWQEVPDETKDMLRQMMERYPSQFEIKDYDAGFFRMSIVDSRQAVLVKRSLSKRPASSEGVAYTEDMEFIRDVLSEFFTLKFTNARRPESLR